MAVRNAEDLEQALNRAVFAGPAVQHVERAVGLERAQRHGDLAVDVDGADLVAANALQRIGAGRARPQRHLPLRRPSAHQDRDVFHRARSIPILLISHSSSMPELAFTRARTVSPKVSMSAALALPRLMRKLQCNSDTCASPTFRPRQ